MTPVSLERTAGWTVEAGTGGPVTVSVAWPEAEAPPDGFPVLAVLDAQTTFATAVAAARLQAGRPAATGVGPGVVLGLGHPGDKAAQTAARRRDYTPPPFDAAGGTGGADAFLDLLDTVVLPAVERVVAIDRERVALFGHSIAALLPLHALLTRPQRFRCCIAASPSLWWDEGVMLQRARGFAAPGCRLLLTVGGLERPEAALADGQAERAARLGERNMVGNVAALADRLRDTVAVRCVEFAGENHGSVLPAAISRAVPFALGMAA